MWEFTEINAFDSISLHDCRTDDIRIEGNDLVINFPDGFWITAFSKHIDTANPLKTGPSQIRFIDVNIEPLIDSIYLYKDVKLFGKTLFSKRILLEMNSFLKLINDGKHELEFLYEFHNPLSNLYQCWVWKRNHGMVAECQLELTSKSIAYCWNEIHKDREW